MLYQSLKLLYAHFIKRSEKKFGWKRERKKNENIKLQINDLSSHHSKLI